MYTLRWSSHHTAATTTALIILLGFDRPGTHLLTGTAGKPINPDMIEPRRAEVPPAQVVVPKGGAVFRGECPTVYIAPTTHNHSIIHRSLSWCSSDLRCWHRGMPNFSATPRHMLGIGYCAERDPNGECSHLGVGKHRHVFSASARDAFNTSVHNHIHK